jgi:MtN3 and saliva related transmembrane protein
MSTVIGLLAGTLTTIAWLPQLARTWRRRSAADISWSYLATTGLGVFLWFIYGLVTRAFPVIVANAISDTLVCSLIILKAFGSAPRDDELGGLDGQFVEGALVADDGGGQR